MITHYVEEALDADRVVLMWDGKILANGTPREILTDMELLKQTRLKPPMTVQLYYELKAQGIELDECPLSNTELTKIPGTSKIKNLNFVICGDHNIIRTDITMDHTFFMNFL